jgi:O-succinylbenzoic acid--CoA ligase
VPTSGTQGAPKLVVLTERALVASARANWANLGVEDAERWLLCLPLGHIGGLSILTRCLLVRRTVVLSGGAGGTLRRAGELCATIEQHAVTLASLVPAALDALLDRGLEQSASLRAVLLGGAGSPPALLVRARQRGLPLPTSYGLTDPATQVTTRRYADRARAPVLYGGLPGAGHPLPGVSLRIGDDHVIQIKGPSLLAGYWGEPPLPDEAWFRSGDRGALTADGELVVLGRADDLIITGGENVDPLAIESIVSRFPGLRAACVFGVDDARFGQIVAAALALAPGVTPSAQDLCAFFEANLSSHERPRLVAILPELPLTGTGKLDRQRVKESALPRLLTLKPTPH